MVSQLEASPSDPDIHYPEHLPANAGKSGPRTRALRAAGATCAPAFILRGHQDSRLNAVLLPRSGPALEFWFTGRCLSSLFTANLLLFLWGALLNLTGTQGFQL